MSKKPFQRKDRFYFKAKQEGYPARSAYKLMELDDRFGIFKKGRSIVDLGCAPGGWLKVAEERLGEKGILAGIDLLPVQCTLGPQTLFLQANFLAPSSQEWLEEKIPHGADWILSDLSPNISGIKFRDEFQSYELCRQAFQFAQKNLKKSGGFLFKVFPGPELDELRKELKVHFEKIVTVIPEATRQSSSEIYVVCVRKKSANP